MRTADPRKDMVYAGTELLRLLKWMHLPIDVKTLCRKMGVNIATPDFLKNSPFPATWAPSATGEPYILLDPSIKEKSIINYAIGHELYHFLRHEIKQESNSTFLRLLTRRTDKSFNRLAKKFSRKEQAASSFSLSLIMPEPLFKEDIKKYALPELENRYNTTWYLIFKRLPYTSPDIAAGFFRDDGVTYLLANRKNKTLINFFTKNREVSPSSVICGHNTFIVGLPNFGRLNIRGGSFSCIYFGNARNGRVNLSTLFIEDKNGILLLLWKRGYLFLTPELVYIEEGGTCEHPRIRWRALKQLNSPLFDEEEVGFKSYSGGFSRRAQGTVYAMFLK